MDQTLGEIRLFAGNFAPRGWAFCDGQLLAIAQNDALFSLLGTMYGGDGRTSFGLPDLRGRIPIGQGTGPGLTHRSVGVTGGAENVVLSTQEIPPHSHTLRGNNSNGTTNVPTNAFPAVAPDSEYNATSDVMMGATNADGGSREHTNVQPFLALNYIISLVGTYPSRP